jgi:hypothetical protein
MSRKSVESLVRDQLMAEMGRRIWEWEEVTRETAIDFALKNMQPAELLTRISDAVDQVLAL